MMLLPSVKNKVKGELDQVTLQLEAKVSSHPSFSAHLQLLNRDNVRSSHQKMEDLRTTSLYQRKAFLRPKFRLLSIR